MKNYNPITTKEVLYLALAIVTRFKCKKIARKPDAHSWAIEQDFIEGAKAALLLCGKSMHPIIEEFQKSKRSITTIKLSDF